MACPSLRLPCRDHALDRGYEVAPIGSILPPTSGHEGHANVNTMSLYSERIPVGAVDAHIEHVDRYVFASRYVNGKYALDAACSVG